MVGAKVRYRDPVKVVDEMESLAAYGFNQINLADDLFTANAGHCTAVCDEIMKRGLTVKWTSFARVDTVSLTVLEKMKTAGCTAVSFGVETGSPTILKTIRKGITLDQVIAAVNLCTRAGLQPYASFILGLPGETEQTLQETLVIDLNKKPVEISGQSLVDPPDLRNSESLALAKSLANVDGALHLGADLRLHGFACLLDGQSIAGEDRARGARYNSALRFTADNPGLLVVVVSSDRPVSIIMEGVELNAQCALEIAPTCLAVPPTLAEWIVQHA